MYLNRLGVYPKPKARLRHMLNELCSRRDGRRFDLHQAISIGAQLKCRSETDFVRLRFGGFSIN